FYFKKYLKIIIFLTILISIYLIKVLFYQEVGATLDIALFIASFGYGLYLNEEERGLRIFGIIYTFVVFILIYYFLTGVHPDEISEYSSENIVNFIILAFSIVVIGLYNKRENKIIVTPAIVSILTSLWTTGRTGIISSFILLVGILLLK